MNLNINDNNNELSPMNNYSINKFDNAIFTKTLKIDKKSSLYSSKNNVTINELSEQKGISLICNEKSVNKTLCTTTIKDVDSFEIHNESKKSILFSTEITSKSKQ